MMEFLPNDTSMLPLQQTACLSASSCLQNQNALWVKGS